MIDRTQNLADMKNKIISFMKIRGPCLPIHISKETKTSLLLASAFLADLVSEKTVKISNMKVGGSPLYFLPGQEAMLENFQNFLNSKEREAFLMLKEKKVLKDSDLEPAIRVALRSIKDFAKPYTINFQNSNMIFWQHHLLGDEEAKPIISAELEKIAPQSPAVQEEAQIKEAPEIKVEEKVKEVVESAVKQQISEEKNNIEPIFPEIKVEKQEKTKRIGFIEEIKSILPAKNFEIEKFEKIDKKEIATLVRKDGKRMVLFAFDKKRVSEQEILKAYRKASSLNLPYFIMLRDNLSKKQNEIIEAYKNLESIDKI